MDQSYIDHYTEQVSRLCAVLLVQAHGLETLSHKIDIMSAKIRTQMRHEYKHALTEILKATAKIKFNMEYLSDWAARAAVTDKGNVGADTIDVLFKDASDTLNINLLLFNACYNDPDARVKVASYLLSLTKNTLIDQKIIDELKTKV